MKLSSILLVVAVVAVMALAAGAWAQDGVLQPIPAEAEAATMPMPASRRRYWYGTSYNPAAAWHGYNYDSAWGMPYALVVPPTARYQKQLGWGVGSSRMSRINYQFQRRVSRPGALRSPAPSSPRPVGPATRANSASTMSAARGSKGLLLLRDVHVGVFAAALAGELHQEILARRPWPGAELDRVDDDPAAQAVDPLQLPARQLRVVAVGEQVDHVGAQLDRQRAGRPRAKCLRRRPPS